MLSKSFFAEMMKRFSQQTYDEYIQGQGYLDKKQRKEDDTRRARIDKMKTQKYDEYIQGQEYLDKMKLYWKQEYLDRNYENGEDIREYYTAKEELWLCSKQEEPAWVNFRMKCSRDCTIQS